jgi:hypothetical protein
MQTGPASTVEAGSQTVYWSSFNSVASGVLPVKCGSVPWQLPAALGIREGRGWHGARVAHAPVLPSGSRAGCCHEAGGYQPKAVHSSLQQLCEADSASPGTASGHVTTGIPDMQLLTCCTRCGRHWADVGACMGQESCHVCGRQGDWRGCACATGSLLPLIR